MAKDYSNYQRKVINRYYDNLDTIALTRLQELVTELYLQKNTTKEDKLWERVDKAMEKLKVKPKLREHIMQKRRVEVLAKNLEDWLATGNK
jgi:alcohol dehydrogenase class IV